MNRQVSIGGVSTTDRMFEVLRLSGAVKTWPRSTNGVPLPGAESCTIPFYYPFVPEDSPDVFGTGELRGTDLRLGTHAFRCAARCSARPASSSATPSI